MTRGLIGQFLFPGLWCQSTISPLCPSNHSALLRTSQPGVYLRKLVGRASTVFTTALICAAPASSQRLIVPQSASVADSFPIRVEGLRPRQAIVLRGAVPDSAGRIWMSHAGFYAGSDGR